MNIKDEIQKQIVEKIQSKNGHGIIAGATGIGKAKIAIDYIKTSNFEKILWVVPFSKLRDVTVPDEIARWGNEEMNEKVEKICYKSLHKVHGVTYDLVILDEAHYITPLSATFFDNNEANRVLVLTATVPEEHEKTEILASLGLSVIDKISVDNAVENKLIAPYNVKLIPIILDTRKTVLAGNKYKKFYVSEVQQYAYLCNVINKFKKEQENALFPKKVPELFYFNRMRFIYNLPSKTAMAKKVLDKIPNDKRIIIFCGSIKQAQALCPYTYHSKTSDKHYKAFNNKEINRLAVVNALNEGHNMVDVDMALMVQINSKERNYIQRQGRVLRMRKGHVATIYVMYAKNTVDEDWLNYSLKNIDKSKVKMIANL